jgi:hypothetical protein
MHLSLTFPERIMKRHDEASGQKRSLVSYTKGFVPRSRPSAETKTVMMLYLFRVREEKTAASPPRKTPRVSSFPSLQLKRKL